MVSKRKLLERIENIEECLESVYEAIANTRSLVARGSSSTASSPMEMYACGCADENEEMACACDYDAATEMNDEMEYEKAESQSPEAEFISSKYGDQAVIRDLRNTNDMLALDLMAVREQAVQDEHRHKEEIAGYQARIDALMGEVSPEHVVINNTPQSPPIDPEDIMGVSNSTASEGSGVFAAIIPDHPSKTVVTNTFTEEELQTLVTRRMKDIDPTFPDGRP